MTTGRHGWTEFTGLYTAPADGEYGFISGSGRIAIAPIRGLGGCICIEQGQCHRLATQEDFLCDECRAGEH